jgi:hypothetical protein
MDRSKGIARATAARATVLLARLGDGKNTKATVAPTSGLGARSSTTTAGSSTLYAALLVAATLAAGVLCALTASAAVADDHVTWIQGFRAPGTPPRYNKVGILQLGPPRAKNVLIFTDGGTLGGTAYIAPIARTLLSRISGWQIWSVENRSNLLEDQSMIDRLKEGKASIQQAYDYYGGWLADPSITSHIRLIPNSEVAFAKRWGILVEVNDLRRVVTAAKRLGGRVVMAGHSFGGVGATAYATWDFQGKPGANDLAGLVYDDNSSEPTTLTATEAKSSLATLDEPSSSPWYDPRVVLPPPFPGIFTLGSALFALLDPNGPATLAQNSGLLPPSFVPPVPVTNLSYFGWLSDTQTAPTPAQQAHVGHLTPSGTPRGWARAGELTPLKRLAEMFSGWGLKNVDGVNWYVPKRETVDADAIGAGNPNPAQKVLALRAIHGHSLPKHLRIYAFRSYYAWANDVVRALARQSHLPKGHLTLVDRHGSYASNDPAGAFPRDAFLAHLIPFLKQIATEH